MENQGLPNGIKLYADNLNGETLYIGAAPTPKEPSFITVKGILSAPGDYFEQRLDTIDPLKCVVIANAEDVSIEFIESVVDPFSSKVSGSIKPYADFEKLNINQDQYQSVKATAKQLTRFKGYFNDVEEWSSTCKRLASVTAKLTKSLSEADDDRGNVNKQFEQQLENFAEIKFVLNMPLFKGDDKRKFTVEVVPDVIDNQIKVRLDSPELYEMQLTIKEQLLANELTRFKGLAIIRQ